MSERPACRTCIWWDAGEPGHGLCRKNPPITNGWPETHASDWCGDWDNPDDMRATRTVVQAGRGPKP